jgi:Cellulase (glycosyl hydrolase family 5)
MRRLLYLLLLLLTCWTHGSQQTSIVTDNFAANSFVTGNSTITNSLGGFAQDLNGNLVSFPANTRRITNQGWLIETTASTNLITQNQFASGWTGSGASVNANDVVSPDNTTDAMFLKEDTSTGSHNFSNNAAFAKPATVGNYVISFFVSRSATGSPRDLLLTWFNGSFANLGVAQFNLQTGIVQYSGTPTGAYINKGCLPASNGFWLCYLAITSDAVANFNANFGLVNNSTTPWAMTGGTSYTGDGVSGIYIFLPQIELGQFPSSRILTAASQVTRPADVVTLTGTAAAALNSAAGTAIISTTGGEVYGSSQTLIDSNGTPLLGFNSSGNLTDGITSALTTANGGSLVAFTDQSAIAWDGTGRSLVLNGGSAVTDAVVQTPSATLHLGASGFNGYVKSLTVFNTKQASPQSNFSLAAGGTLFGVGLSGAENPSPVFPLSTDWSYLGGKGVKLVRLTLAWENLQPTLGAALSPTYVASINTALASAAANGIKVILDVHNFAHYVSPAQFGSTISVPGNGGASATGVSGIGDAGLPISDFTNLWTLMATAFGGNSGLAGYGLMNEPQNLASTSTWNTAAQDAVNGIRSVDTTTPIYVSGDGTISTAGFAPSFWQPTQVTGTGLIHEGHQYFDYNPALTSPSAPGVYTGTYTSFATTNYQGILAIQAWLGWLKKNNQAGFLGEYGIPNSSADNNAQWFNVQGNLQSAVVQQGVVGAMFFYGANNSGSGTVLQFNPVGGVDDPRLTQMLGKFSTNWLLKRDLDPASNDNDPMWLAKAA